MAKPSFSESEKSKMSKFVATMESQLPQEWRESLEAIGFIKSSTTSTTSTSTTTTTSTSTTSNSTSTTSKSENFNFVEEEKKLIGRLWVYFWQILNPNHDPIVNYQKKKKNVYLFIIYLIILFIYLIIGFSKLILILFIFNFLIFILKKLISKSKGLLLIFIFLFFIFYFEEINKQKQREKF